MVQNKDSIDKQIHDLPGWSYPDKPTARDVENLVTKQKPSKKASGGFQVMGLSYPVLKGVTRRGYKIPTPIQRKTIPLILEGRDVVAMAKTGSGKTACFLIPLFEKLKARSAKSGARALILSPTRELAIQTYRFIKDIGKFTDLKSILVLGGDSMDQQFSAIHTSPDVIVATPGRFLHLCVEMDLKLNSIEYCVCDEADRLFEMGFGEQLNETLNRLPANKQMVMFSATLPKLLVDFARAGLSDPVLIRLDVESKLPEALTLKFIHCRPDERYSSMLVLLKYVIPRKAQTVVFAGTQHHVELISFLLTQAGVSNTYVYSSLDPSARKINTAKFAGNKVSVLIVTDVAARGIDIPNLDYVINVHFPGKPKLFVHRVGRCARAGREGTAFTLFATDDEAHMLDLHLFLSRPFSLEDNKAMGVIPRDLLEEEHFAVIQWLKSPDVSGVYRTSINAYKHYITTRPAASADSNKRVKTIKFFKLKPLDVFKNDVVAKSESAKDVKYAEDEDKKEHVSAELKYDLLTKMKQYRPAGTVFELNPHKMSVEYSVMKNKRQAHKDVIERFQRTCNEREKEEQDNKRPQSDSEDEAGMKKESQPEYSDTELNEAFEKVISSKKRKNLEDLYVTKKRKRVVKDTENYIPYQSADKHTEDGLAINNFQRDAQKAEFTVGADNNEGHQITKKLKKWDRRLKKMVSVVDPRQGKIRTESGIWIPATYKTGRYADWKHKSKIDERTERDEGNDDDDEKKEKQKPRRVPNTHWARHNVKMDEKKRYGTGDSEIKKPEQIAKKRLRVEHIKEKQAKNHVKREMNRKRTQKNQKRSANAKAKAKK